MKSAWIKLSTSFLLMTSLTACLGGGMETKPPPAPGGSAGQGEQPAPAPAPANPPAPPAFPEPAPAPTPIPGTDPIPAPTPAPGPGPTPTPVPNPVPGPTPTPVPTPNPNPAPQPGPTPVPTPVPVPVPNPTPVPGPTPGPTPSPSPEPVPTPVPVPVPTPQPPAQCTPESGSAVAGTITINDGSPITASKNVVLKFQRDETLKMKISNNAHCGCGVWETFAETKAWVLPSENQSNEISVLFKDYENNSSACVSVSVLHDSLAPLINLSLDPANTYNSGSTTKLNLQIADQGVGVKAIYCSLNGNPMNCEVGSTTQTFANQAPGDYKFYVSAIDILGHSATKEVSWTVVVPYQIITQNHEIKSNKKVDILLIDDNSGSMEYEQKNMAKRMSTFLDQLQGLEWQIAITTTDPKSLEWGDGRLVEMKGVANKETMITSSMDPSKARKALEDTIQRKEIGNSDEQGILVTYRAIERSLSTDPKDAPHKQFFRPDANFAAVVISDEDESATGFKNIPENLLSFVKTTWPSKNFAFHSIITIPGDTKCKSTEGYAYGTVYEKMSKLTGAGSIGGPIIGSVCAEDYGSQLRGIGDSVQSMQKIIDLQCPPIGDVNSSVVVLLNGSNYTAPYQVQDKRVIFEANLPVGQYTLQYKCK